MTRRKWQWVLGALTFILLVALVLPDSRQTILTRIGVGPLVGFHTKGYWINQLKGKDNSVRATAGVRTDEDYWCRDFRQKYYLLSFRD
jgi:hypothetical protein